MSNTPRRSAQKKPPKIVSDVRSPHGTRVMKRIVCSRCGKSDVLPFVPKAGEKSLCESCAQKNHNVVSENSASSADRYIACKGCGDPIPLAKRPREIFIPRGLEDVAEQLSQKEATELCLSCRGKSATARRTLAKKPRGVHPIVVKKK